MPQPPSPSSPPGRGRSPQPRPARDRPRPPTAASFRVDPDPTADLWAEPVAKPSPPVGPPPRPAAPDRAALPLDPEQALDPVGLPLWQQWQLWATLGVTIASSIAGVSAALLLRLPGLPNCPELFLPTASASLRLYCAQAAADKRTIEDLLTAIALVENLPADHPMRAEIENQIELWSTDILDLAEESFQSGDMSQAIATARRIPTQTTAATLVEERLNTWSATWSDAERLYDQGLDYLRQQNFRDAFNLASQLADVGNRYWATTKYQELTDQITIARRDGSKLTEANTQANQGTVAGLLEAIRLAKAIQPTSYAYAAAQTAIKAYVNDLFDLAQAAVEGGRADEAIAIIQQIPVDGDQTTKVDELMGLAQAAASAAKGEPLDLQAAIEQAQRLPTSSPFYSQAQQLIGQWELEIQDIARIALARRLAAPGGVANLRAAIVEAQQVPRRNPRFSEAQTEIAAWTTQVETIEDQPLLTQAEQLASTGGVVALQQAITTAQQIRSGRALYEKAQAQVSTWRTQVETIQDQPLLTEARAIANRGDLSGAIALAERIGAGRALSAEAQTDIRRWRNQVEGETALRMAYQAATVGSVEGLATAIARADRVPNDSASRSEADRMRNIWSQELLRLASTEAGYDLSRAIAIAERIPANTTAYIAAQAQLSNWRAQLSPPSPVPVTPLPPDPVAE